MMRYSTPIDSRYCGSTCSGKPGCFWSRFTATMEKLIGADFCKPSRMSSSA
ncbi:hypothetical protein D3C72_2079980 [compost metagenome]